MTSKKVFMRFSANVGSHYMKSNKVGRHFCPDFQQIKTFRGALAPRLLHHWWHRIFDIAVHVCDCIYSDV